MLPTSNSQLHSQTSSLYQDHGGDPAGSELEYLRAENERLRQLNNNYRNALAYTGHEWRNQISLLNLSITNLEKDDRFTLNDQQKQILEHIQRSAAVILRVARHYLHLPYIENEILRPSQIFVEPAEDIFNPLLLSYTDLLDIRRQTAQLTVSNPHLLIWADRDLLLTACQNLLHAAIDLGPTDSAITLHVLERGNVDEFTIWNRGTQISDHSLRLINLPSNCEFTNTFTSNSQIGLYLACSIIRAHGGMLFSESSTAMGIKFVFTLPKRQTLIRRKESAAGA